jgi:hypothetical protein
MRAVRGKFGSGGEMMKALSLDRSVSGLLAIEFASNIPGLILAGHDCAPSRHLIQTCGA